MSKVVIDDFISNVRAVDRETVLAPNTMRQIIDACLRAVREERAHEERTGEERSVDGVLDRMQGR
jgi:hypothetical protein